MTIYLTSSDGTVLDRYSPPRFVAWLLSVVAALRRGWRAIRSQPSLGRIRMDGPVASITEPTVSEEVVSALVNLGMKKREAQAKIAKCRAQDFDGMLREALAERKVA